MHKYTCTSLYPHTQKHASLFAAFGFLFLLFFLLTACNDSTNKTSNKTNAPAPDSKQLLQQAQDAMKQVNSYHSHLTTDNPGSISGIEIQTADSDVLAPDKIKAKSTVNYNGFLVNVDIIAIGQTDYYTDPFTGNWKPINAIVDPHKVADPQAGIGALLGNIQQPGTVRDSSVDGKSCWRITGQLSTQYIAGMVGNSPPVNGNVNTTVCIGKSDHYPYQLQTNGTVVQGDNTQTTRTIKFSKFNETINIEAPNV